MGHGGKIRFLAVKCIFHSGFRQGLVENHIVFHCKFWQSDTDGFITGLFKKICNPIFL